MNTVQFTTYDTMKYFIIIVAVVALLFGILMFIASYPFKFMTRKIYKYPAYDLTKYYFYYQKASAYRFLFIVHLIFSTTLKILGTASTFITVYCAIDGNEFILLFSLIAAMCQVVSLTIPSEKYSKIYVQAARKLEYILNNGDNLQEPQLSQELIKSYQEAEKIIEDEFI